MFIETSTTPSAASSRSSARGRPRSCGRAMAQSAAEPKRSRRNTTPGGPSCGKSVFATAAPPCTEHAAAITSATADARRSAIYFLSDDAAPAAGVGDREDDQQAEQAAHQHPPRVIERVAVASKTLPEGEQEPEGHDCS